MVENRGRKGVRVVVMVWYFLVDGIWNNGYARGVTLYVLEGCKEQRKKQKNKGEIKIRNNNLTGAQVNQILYTV